MPTRSTPAARAALVATLASLAIAVFLTGCRSSCCEDACGPRGLPKFHRFKLKDSTGQQATDSKIGVSTSNNCTPASATMDSLMYTQSPLNFSCSDNSPAFVKMYANNLEPSCIRSVGVSVFVDGQTRTGCIAPGPEYLGEVCVDLRKNEIGQYLLDYEYWRWSAVIINGQVEYSLVYGGRGSATLSP